MTREQKIEAFSMKLDGKTYQEIGERFGVTRQCIEQALKGVLPERRKDLRNSEKCVYAGLSKYIDRSGCTLTKLAGIIGLSNRNTVTIHKKITGKTDFSLSEINLILDFTGMTFEECFEKKED